MHNYPISYKSLAGWLSGTPLTGVASHSLSSLLHYYYYGIIHSGYSSTAIDGQRQKKTSLKASD